MMKIFNLLKNIDNLLNKHWFSKKLICKLLIFSFVILSSLAVFPQSGNEMIDLNIMTINIRVDNRNDGENQWINRKNIVAQIIKNENIDIVGMQEVALIQLKDLELRLTDYGYIGVGRSDGISRGEFCPIFYKKNCFNVINSGTFWLSETPEIPGSKGWDAVYERIATWAILEEIENQQKIFIINTHFDNIGKIARRESIKLLMNRIDVLHKNLPIIVTGDFNITPDNIIIKQMLEYAYSYQLLHTQDIAELKSDITGTFHNFGKIPLGKRQFIDYIFVSKGIKVLKHAVLTDKLGDIFISDHSPVVSHILLK